MASHRRSCTQRQIFQFHLRLFKRQEKHVRKQPQRRKARIYHRGNLQNAVGQTIDDIRVKGKRHDAPRVHRHRETQEIIEVNQDIQRPRDTVAEITIRGAPMTVQEKVLSAREVYLDRPCANLRNRIARLLENRLHQIRIENPGLAVRHHSVQLETLEMRL